MPLALIVALTASMGLHAVVLFVPGADPSAVSEPRTLQAEIVLRPRPPASPPALQKPAKPRLQTPAKEAPIAVSDPAASAVVPAVSPEPPAPESELEPAEMALPPQGEIVYTVTRGDPGGIIGRASQRWELNDNTYRIASVTETAGLAALLRPVRLETESRGRIVASGLQPETYVSRRIGKEGVERVDFDWNAKLARFSAGGESPLVEGAQDLLSFNFQLGWLSKTGEMSIATAKKLARHRLELVAEEQLETPLGSLRTLHFRSSGETVTEVWLAPEHHLLPVKIRHIDKRGDIYDQLADEIRIPSPEK